MILCVLQSRMNSKSGTKMLMVQCGCILNMQNVLPRTLTTLGNSKKPEMFQRVSEENLKGNSVWPEGSKAYNWGQNWLRIYRREVIVEMNSQPTIRPKADQKQEKGVCHPNLTATLKFSPTAYPWLIATFKTSHCQHRILHFAFCLCGALAIYQLAQWKSNKHPASRQELGI